MKTYDTIIIGGGQAALSVAYFLRRYKLDYLILDNKTVGGGSWLNTWDSLKLFSPFQYSTLSGWMMPKGENIYPNKDEFIQYLQAYEARYQFPILRPVEVEEVHKTATYFELKTNRDTFFSKIL